MQARDFKDEGCRRVWEAIEKARGQMKKVPTLHPQV
jgi:hypothetical protein